MKHLIFLLSLLTLFSCAEPHNGPVYLVEVTHNKTDFGQVDTFLMGQPEIRYINGDTTRPYLVAPNPASENAKILITGFSTHSKEVYMYDLSVRLVFKVQLEADENQIELELNTLNVHSGVYMIRVTDGEVVRTEQLVIQR